MGFRGKALVEVWGEALRSCRHFCENMLFCRGFKNEIAIFAFTTYKCFNGRDINSKTET